MTVRKLSVSLSTELADALDELARSRDEERSRLMETLLREHALVERAIAKGRGVGPPGTKRGRDPRELVLVGRAAGRIWDERERAGRVKLGGGQG